MAKFNAAEHYDALPPEVQRRIGIGACLALNAIEAEDSLPLEQARRWSAAQLVAWDLIDAAGSVEECFEDGPDLIALGIRACQVCGCTDDHGCPEGCSWVGPTLCSSCGSAVPQGSETTPETQRIFNEMKISAAGIVGPVKRPDESLTVALEEFLLCSDCPPVGYPTDETRCSDCPRRSAWGDDPGCGIREILAEEADPGSNDPHCRHQWANTNEDDPERGRIYCTLCGADGDA